MGACLLITLDNNNKQQAACTFTFELSALKFDLKDKSYKNIGSVAFGWSYNSTSIEGLFIDIILKAGGRSFSLPVKADSSESVFKSAFDSIDIFLFENDIQAIKAGGQIFTLDAPIPIHSSFINSSESIYNLFAETVAVMVGRFLDLVELGKIKR